MKDNGSEITVVAGENGFGKTTILDAIASLMLEYKADLFDIKDMNMNLRVYLLQEELEVEETNHICNPWQYMIKSF